MKPIDPNFRREFEAKGVKRVREELLLMSGKKKRDASTWLLEQEPTFSRFLEGEEDEG